MSSTQSKKPKKNANQPVNIYQEKILDPKYKTELCKTFEETGYCPYVNKCRFAHGKNELFNKSLNLNNYKVKKCKSFYCETFCIYGSRCLFRHSDEKENIERSSFSLRISYIKGGLLVYKKELDEYLIDIDEIERILIGSKHSQTASIGIYKLNSQIINNEGMLLNRRLKVFSQLTNLESKKNIKTILMPKDNFNSGFSNSFFHENVYNVAYNNDIDSYSYVFHRRFKKNTLSAMSNFDSKCSTSDNRSPI